MSPWYVWALDGLLRKHGHSRRDIRAVLHPAGRLTRNRLLDMQRFQQLPAQGGPDRAVLLMDDGAVYWDGGDWTFVRLPEEAMALLIDAAAKVPRASLNWL